MNAEFDRQQHEIDRQVAALGGWLDSPTPRPDAVARVKTAVAEETGRLRRRDRRLAALRPLVGAAAALLLAVGLSLSGDPDLAGRSFTLGGDPDAIFTDWVDALDESGGQFARLLEDDWLFEYSAPGNDEYDEFGDPLDSLEESLQSFEEIVGA